MLLPSLYASSLCAPLSSYLPLSVSPSPTTSPYSVPHSTLPLSVSPPLCLLPLCPLSFNHLDSLRPLLQSQPWLPPEFTRLVQQVGPRPNDSGQVSHTLTQLLLSACQRVRYSEQCAQRGKLHGHGTITHSTGKDRTAPSSQVCTYVALVYCTCVKQFVDCGSFMKTFTSQEPPAMYMVHPQIIQ